MIGRIFKFLVFGVLTILLGMTLVLNLRAGGRWHCARCAVGMHSSEWLSPFSDSSLVRSERIDPNPLSELVGSEGLVEAHEHVWLFVGGVRKGSRICGGPGLNLGVLANGPAAAAWLQHLIQEGDLQMVRHWLRVSLNPRAARVVGGFIGWGDHGFPEQGFPDQAAFRQWWDENRPRLEKELRTAGIDAALHEDDWGLHSLAPRPVSRWLR